MYSAFGVTDFINNTDAIEGSQVDLVSSPSKQCDFSSFWSSSTLGKAVLQGKRLRNEKPRYIVSQRQCDVINIDYIKTPRDYRRRSDFTTCNQNREHFCQPKKARKKRKLHRRCPLRIAELAVPSKRQCLDTWRSKYTILPDYMVERLKQQVLDQRPIVEISDAIYCFKTRTTSSPKRVCKKRKNVERIWNDCQADTKALCAIFGHKIALYLNKPMAVNLTPRLERLSNIVSDEISNLLRKKMCMNKTMNKRNLYETAAKVSIWMELILEESTHKLQEDELNDLEEEIGPILDLIDDLVENILDICAPDTLDYVLSTEESEESSLTLEYEEKAASEISVSKETRGLEEFQAIGEDYDVIETEHQKPTENDGMIENEDITPISNFFRNEIHDIILNMNDEFEINLNEENIVSVDETEDGFSQIGMPDTDTNTFLDSLELQTDIDSSLPINEDVKDILEDILSKNIISDDIFIDVPESNIEEELENNDVTANPNKLLENKYDKANLNEQVENKDDTNNLNEPWKNKDDSDNLNKQLENKDNTDNLNEQLDNKDDTDNLNEQLKNKDDTANPNELLENKDDPANLNVSEKSQIISEDDDNNKKVKFSNIDMGTRGQLEIHSDTHLLDIHLDTEKEQVSWKASADNIKSSIIFAPPNKNLLSDADESWPENIPSPVLRPSESISRSITSLGRILETDEKFPVSSESDDVPKNYKEQVDQQIRNTIESLKTNGLNQMYKNKETKDKVIKKKRIVESKEKTAEGYRQQKHSFSRDPKKLAGTRKTSPHKTTEKVERPKDLPKVKNKQNLEKYRAYNNEDSKKDKKDSSKTDKIDLNTHIIKENKANKSVAKRQPNSTREENQIERAKSVRETSRNQKMQLKRDYKVNEATAPNWLKHKRADMQKELTFGMNQYEIRKWCNDLKREFGRFETWNDWLECTCRNFVNLHQNRALSSRVARCDFKRWIKLKRNLDTNVSTWAKLHRRTQHRLNQTIYICDKPSAIVSPKRYPRRCTGRNLRKSPSSPQCSTYRNYF